MVKKTEVEQQLDRLYSRRGERAVIPTVPVGFDYSLTVVKLKAKLGAASLVEYLNFKDRESLRDIENGAIPNHLVGEALFVLYQREFNGEKPPMLNLQRYGFRSSEEENAYFADYSRQTKGVK